MIKRPSPQVLTAAAVLAVLAAVAIVTAPSEAPRYDSYASTDYRGGGYRAWAALLAREGVNTSRFVLRPIELDTGIDTLIAAQPLRVQADPGARTEADLAALARWVSAGGRLVYIGRNAALKKAERGLLNLPVLVSGADGRGRLRGAWAAEIGALAGLGADRMRFVNHGGAAELRDGNGDIVARYPLGRGEILAVTDPVPFTNAAIVAAGNARLAYLLGVPRRPGGVVAFDDGLHGALIDRPWYRALPLPIRLTLGLLALTGLLAMVGSALPVGPAIRLQPVREPTSVEFVDAVCALYERIGARAAAAATLARDALAAAARPSGLPDAVAPATLAAHLGPGARTERVRRLADVLATPVATDAELLASAKLAHIVRKEWSHGRNVDGSRAAFASRTRTRRRR